MTRRVLIVLAVMIVAFACTKKPEEKNIAIVNGKDITRADFEQRVSDQMQQHAGQEAASMDESKLREAILEQMITETLLLEGAAEAGIQVTDEEINNQLSRIRKNYADEAAYLEQIKKRGYTEESFKNYLKERLMISKFRASLADPESVTEEEMQQYFADSPVPLMSPARIKMRMVQAKDEAGINKVEAVIKEKGFEKAAEEFAKEGTAVVSQSDWVQPDTFSSATAEAVKNAKIGDLVGPLQGMGGWYMMRIDDKEEPKVESYDEAKEKIRNLVLMQKRQGQEHIWVMKRMDKSDIKKFL